MLNRQAQPFVEYPRAGTGGVRRNDQHPPVDLGAPVHPRRIFLADVAALGEAHPVQLGRIAFEPEDVADLPAAFADSKPEPVFQPAAGRIIR
jgi:hypothetical protein